MSKLSRKKIAYLNLSWIFLSSIIFYNNCGGNFDAGSAKSYEMSSLDECSKRSRTFAAPSTIEEAIWLINSLPKPTTIECFVASLERPIEIYATASTASVQRASGERSPRIFIFKSNLIMAVVPEGAGKNFVEFSQLKSTGRTLKAEVQFPIVTLLSTTEPFDRIRNANGTTCGICHLGEAQDPDIKQTAGYISDLLKPLSFFRVSPARLESEKSACNIQLEPERCRLLNAILNYGPISERNFGQ